MTVSLITTIQNFIGLSTDTKPTNVPPGSTFWAWDTGTLFKTYDGTNWIAYSVNSVVQPGTIDLHQGEDADSRMIDAAENRGYNITSISRWFEDKDFEEFDHIMVMDDNNFQTLLTRTKNPKHIKKIEFITDYRKKFLKNYIPDPYYGGDKGFDNVIDLLEDSCQGFLEKITSNQG